MTERSLERSDGPGRETVVADPAWVRPAAWVVCPVIGIAVLLALVLFADWLLTLPWLPLDWVVKLVDRLPDPVAYGLAGAIGLVGGLVLASYVAADLLTVRVADDALSLVRGTGTVTVRRSDSAAVFVDKKHLVVLGHDTAELARVKNDKSVKELAPAFRNHGWAWADGDPHLQDFRLWVDGGDGLPPGANAVLKALAAAIKKDDDEALVAELRTELSKLGVVVRDHEQRQYWRAPRRLGSDRRDESG